jgi:hypothetical protein
VNDDTCPRCGLLCLGVHTEYPDGGWEHPVAVKHKPPAKRPTTEPPGGDKESER